MCESIYMGNIKKTFNKIMGGHLSDLLRLLNNGQKLDSFAAHFEQQFNSTIVRTNLRKYMALKVVRQINHIGSIKTFTKPNYNLCMEEPLKILKIYMINVSWL